MIYVSHITFSLFFVLLSLIFYKIFNYIPVFSLALIPFFSLLPDIDTKSKITTKSKILNFVYKFFFENKDWIYKHRRITHSLVFAILISFFF